MASYDVFEPLFTNQFIGGEWTASSSPNRIAVENPATLEKFAEIPDGTVDDIDRAVDAAYESLPAWRATPLEKRRALMQRFLEHFKAMRQAIIDLEAADFIGNPSINFVKGTAQVEAGGMRVDSPLGQLGFERGDMTEAAPQSGSVDVTIGVRPEQLSISRQADDAHWVEGHVYSGMPAGSETLVSVRVGDTMLTVKELGSTHYASDEPVYLGFNPKKVNVFETKSENLIKYCV